MKKNSNFFDHFIDGLDAKAQAYLNYYFAHERMKEQFIRRSEKEQMKREITEEVLSNIRFWLYNEAEDELRDLFNSLGF